MLWILWRRESVSQVQLIIQSIYNTINHIDKFRVQVLQLSEPLDGTMYFHKEKAKVSSQDQWSSLQNIV